MTVKIGINGFGRIGRLVFRILAEEALLPNSRQPHKFELVRINDPAGSAKSFAHLVNFDSVHGRWHTELDSDDQHSDDQYIVLHDNQIEFSRSRTVEETDWGECDIVIEASGQFRTKQSLQPFFNQGVKKVVVTAPVKEGGVANIVMGVNDQAFDLSESPIVTAASCTTNCLAPIVKVIDRELGIRHASITTIHALTNTQTIIDAPHKDPRRARACGMSLIPTTTGSATAITQIFPHLSGKINGHAVRVPLTNPSLTDCIFELNRDTTAEQVNAMLSAASQSPELNGILGYEERPLVSIDYRGDPRSCVIDAPCTMVIDDTHLKLYAWYDNEWGYANRTAELVALVSSSIS